MGIFINSYESISPVNALNKEIIPEPQTSELGYYECQSLNYKEFIEPKLSRRMSKVVKMGVACAKKCLSAVGLEQPDAISLGTGLGCVKDTAKFLNQIVDNDEQMLAPTAFIQSTHNTVSGQIALMLQCRNHNFTFSQKNISFESALLELEMSFADGLFEHGLLIGVDELTEESYELLKRTNCLYSEKNKNGYIAGEGAAAFSVSAKKTVNSICEIKSIAINTAGKGLKNELNKRNIQADGVDFVLSGNSHETFQGIPTLNYKQFCGEYDTASAFSLWMACLLIDRNRIPGLDDLQTPERLNNILILNKYKDQNQSLIQLSKC